VKKTARLIAGAAVLALLGVIAVLLIPPYAANWRLQSYLNDFADDAAASHKSVGIVRSEVLNAAAALGLPVTSDDVQVTSTPTGVRIDVLYIVHVDLAGYTIDLHFRPQAGG
jgi:hypothetical protein